MHCLGFKLAIKTSELLIFSASSYMFFLNRFYEGDTENIRFLSLYVDFLVVSPNVKCRVVMSPGTVRKPGSLPDRAVHRVCLSVQGWFGVRDKLTAMFGRPDLN